MAAAPRVPQELEDWRGSGTAAALARRKQDAAIVGRARGSGVGAGAEEEGGTIQISAASRR